jgi:hypothetical protein
MWSTYALSKLVLTEGTKSISALLATFTEVKMPVEGRG